MSAKTIMVVGASGFLGSNLVQFLRKRHKVIAAFNRNILPLPGVTHTIYSLTDRDYMKRVFSLLKPEVVIYCAGVTDFHECARKPQLAEAVNTLGAVSLSSYGDGIPHRLIYITSPYVFDGKKGNYSEHDVTSPDTQFGKSQLAGANIIFSKVSMYTIFRFSPLIGKGSIFHPGIIDRIRMKLQKGERVELPQNETHSFLSLDVAMQAIEWAATQETRNTTYHLGGLTKVNYYEMGQILAKRFKMDSNLVVPGKGNLESGGDFSLNGSELVKQLEIDPLVLEKSLDLFKQSLIR